MHALLRRACFALVWMAAASAIAQGSIIFNTRWGAVDAPVIYLGDNSLADDRFLAQLYAGPPAGGLQPVGVPHPFRSDEGRGYVAGETVEVPGITPGSRAQVKMVAWSRLIGDSYEEAWARAGGAGTGESSIIILQLGGGVVPPAPLLGLKGFFIQVVPEPSPLALMMAGWVALYRVPLGRRSAGVSGGRLGHFVGPRRSVY
ncbi:MAG: hypothetical protein JNK85_27145 [Verrucomicrobiales bacterium]|nr:hypothetical protein [Verrucomicrobiales bacterium]